MNTYFGKYQVEGAELLNILSEDLGNELAPEEAALTLKAVLSALRNRLNFEQAHQFFERLPAPFKVMYLQGWEVKPIDPETLEGMDDLIGETQRSAEAYTAILVEHDDAQRAIISVFSVIHRCISPKRMRDILCMLPEDVKGYLEASLKQHHALPHLAEA